jgi:hypothetical protein
MMKPVKLNVARLQGNFQVRMLWGDDNREGSLDDLAIAVA